MACAFFIAASASCVANGAVSSILANALVDAAIVENGLADARRIMMPRAKRSDRIKRHATIRYRSYITVCVIDRLSDHLVRRLDRDGLDQSPDGRRVPPLDFFAA
jgi:hypothetical protein